MLIHGPAHSAGQFSSLCFPIRFEPEPVGHPVPVLGVHRHCRVAPEVPPDLGRYLEHDELVGPGREPALPPELAKLAENGQQGVGSRRYARSSSSGPLIRSCPPRRRVSPVAIFSSSSCRRASASSRSVPVPLSVRTQWSEPGSSRGGGKIASTAGSAGVMLTILRNQRPCAATAHKPQAVGKTSAPPGVILPCLVGSARAGLGVCEPTARISVSRGDVRPPLPPTPTTCKRNSETVPRRITAGQVPAGRRGQQMKILSRRAHSQRALANQHGRQRKDQS